MAKIDIISGFLGAGKTTLIKKLVKDCLGDEKLVIIENEFGDIGIDGGFLQESGIQVTEMNSGCICCSLVGDFGRALEEVVHTYNPDRIIIEPSGVGKLSDVIGAVENVGDDNLIINSFCAVVDASKCKMYMKNFGEFYNNQIESAGAIILSHTDKLSADKLENVLNMIREHNDKAQIITTSWNELDGSQILECMEGSKSLEDELNELMHEQVHHHDDDCCCGHHDHDEHDHECCHHHDHDEHDHDCCHHHDHDEHDHECCHHHDHDEHDHDCCHHDHDEHDHECCHHHDHDEHDHECCHHHDHDEHDHECCHHDHDEHEHHHDEHCCGHDHNHQHHHADEVFISWGKETAKVFTKEEIESALNAFADADKFGIILRAKGIVAGDGVWYHFDYTPDDIDIRTGSAAAIGRLCVIGSHIDENEIEALFK